MMPCCDLIEGLKLDDDVSLFLFIKKKMRGTTLLDVDFGQFWSSFNDLHFTGSHSERRAATRDDYKLPCHEDPRIPK